MTRKEQILKLLKDTHTIMTCQELTKKIAKKEKLSGNRLIYLSGSISSILRKMVKDGILKYANIKDSRGDHTYQLNS